jgi:hypothetical protein
MHHSRKSRARELEGEEDQIKRNKTPKEGEEVKEKRERLDRGGKKLLITDGQDRKVRHASIQQPVHQTGPRPQTLAQSHQDSRVENIKTRKRRCMKQFGKNTVSQASKRARISICPVPYR